MLKWIWFALALLTGWAAPTVHDPVLTTRTAVTVSNRYPPCDGSDPRNPNCNPRYSPR